MAWQAANCEGEEEELGGGGGGGRPHSLTLHTDVKAELPPPQDQPLLPPCTASPSLVALLTGQAEECS